MVEVTEEAANQIQEYFKDKEVTPIRIFLNAGGVCVSFRIKFRRKMR